MNGLVGGPLLVEGLGRNDERCGSACRYDSTFFCLIQLRFISNYVAENKENISVRNVCIT